MIRTKQLLQNLRNGLGTYFKSRGKLWMFKIIFLEIVIVLS